MAEPLVLTEAVGSMLRSMLINKSRESADRLTRLSTGGCIHPPETSNINEESG
jgi:hypothetical protein